MTRRLTTLVAVLLTACVSEDADRGEGGITPPGPDTRCVRPDGGVSAVGDQMAWDSWWTRDCYCGGTEVCTENGWVSYSTGCGGSQCQNLTPAEAEALYGNCTWEGTGCGAGTGSGEDTSGGEGGGDGACEGVACDMFSCDDALDRIEELVGGGRACETPDDCTVVGESYDCDCVPSLFGSGVAVNRDAAATLLPYLDYVESGSCDDEIWHICDAAPATDLRCEDGFCVANQASCLGGY